MNNQNITGTGIAVAIAVIVVLGLLLFNQQIFSFISGKPLTATNTPQNAQVASTNSTTNTTNPSTMNPNIDLSDIPANPTELMSKDVTVGTGAEAQPGDQVTVNYVGMLTNGQVFDASADHGNQGFTFTLGAGQVIKGWDEGVSGMKVGGTRELVIPASLGYGAQAVGPIPANSTLVFEVQLLNVQPGSTAQPANQ